MVSLVAPTYSLKGKPHWRRTQQVYAVLNQAPPEATYDRLIELVRQSTGKGCSRKLISKWKKTVISHQLPVTSKPIENNQDEPPTSNGNASPVVISSEQSFVETTLETNQAEVKPIQNPIRMKGFTGFQDYLNILQSFNLQNPQISILLG